MSGVLRIGFRKTTIHHWLIAASLGMLCSDVSAIPPAEPFSFQQACKSTSIVKAVYTGYSLRDDQPIDYFSPPLAHFRVDQVLGGEPLSGTIKVRYEFDNGSACLAPENWRFSESFMPDVGSEWILFIFHEHAGVYSTYGGNFGRMEATENNVQAAADCR